MKKLLLLLLAGITTIAGAAMDIPADRKTGGFAVGCQAYSFRLFTVLEAIEKTAQAGGKVIEFYPGQRFSPDQGDLRWNHDATDEMIATVEKQLKRSDILAINYGVVGVPSNIDEARKIFEFAKRLGLQGITTESMDSLDTLEKLVQEYDIHVSFHNHPRRPKDPSYRMWDPNYIREQLEGRDERIGACVDIGHWIRSGLDPVESLRILEGRIISSHMKDRESQPGHDVHFGTGIGNTSGVLEELRRQNFSGHLSIEYEHNWENSVPDIAASIGFIRGYGTARGWKK